MSSGNRVLVVASGVVLVALSLRAQTVPARAPDPRAHTAAERAQLTRVLEPLHARYDPAGGMLRQPFGSPGYHTKFKGGYVHGTRPALEYAVALLDTGEEPWRARAEDILRRVTALQDQDPASRTYGIWSWFLEEPLAQMSPPDWNWADFCGVQLLQVARDHRSRLTPEVAKMVDDAIRHAARSIERRNVGPSYTNIAIMGTYVTLVASEFYGWDDLHAYAMKRLRRFHDYTKEQGAFTEYNSPTYTVVAVSELGRLRLHARDEEALRLVEDLYRVAWEDIAAHFHPPTRQWAGPHSRCYSTLLGRGTLAFLQRGTGGRVDLGADEPGLADLRLPVPCPDDLVPRFASLGATQDVVKTYLKGDPPIVATTHLDPSFALGSANRSNFWNQCRPLVAYWGTASRPSSLQVRFLHDDYDYTSAQFFGVQRGGDVLAAINFATDGGDTHPNLDRVKDATIRARDLRLRFEFAGDAATAALPTPTTPTDPVRIASGDVRIQLVVSRSHFGDLQPHWESGMRDRAATLDLVIYEGPERTISFRDLGEAAIGLALRISSGEASPPRVTSDLNDGSLVQEWDGLRLSVPARPDTIGNLVRGVRY
jgi:hypothetical protein